MTTPSRPEPREGRSTGAPGAAQWAGQVLLYGLFALAIGVFSQWPPYRPIGSDQAVIKISVTRLGQPVGECRRLSPDELAKLPPNMRDPLQCPRERSPLTMEVDVGGQRVLQRVAPPSGLSKDGSASIYERLVVAAGPQRIDVHFKDDVRPGAVTYHRQASVNLVPGQVLVVDFDAEKGGITLQ